MTLKGKTALITGSCGGGIGRCTALRLASEGANIVLNYGTFRRGAEMRAAAEQTAFAVEELGGRAVIHEAATSRETEVRAMVDGAHDSFGAIDILVNNAGGPFKVRDFTAVPLEEWQATLRAEIDGPFLLMKHVVPEMRRRRWGRVIHIGAECAVQNPVSAAPDYFLGKAARGWMALAFGPKEAGHGVTMNSIEPGLTAFLPLDVAVQLCRGKKLEGETTLYHPESDRPIWRGRYEDRPGPTSLDVAETIAYLCTEKARFLSGELIRFPFFPEPESSHEK